VNESDSKRVALPFDTRGEGIHRRMITFPRHRTQFPTRVSNSADLPDPQAAHALEVGAVTGEQTQLVLDRGGRDQCVW
jgi:hypothetical protein